MVAVLLAAIAVLLNYFGEPHGNTIVVRVRVWDAPIAEAYRQSFEAFHRAHPDIDVRVDLVAYSTYFNTLRTDVAGGSADDIFWLSNAYLRPTPTTAGSWILVKPSAHRRLRSGSPRSSTSSPAAQHCGVCRS